MVHEDPELCENFQMRAVFLEFLEIDQVWVMERFVGTDQEASPTEVRALAWRPSCCCLRPELRQDAADAARMEVNLASAKTPGQPRGIAPK